MTEDRQMVQLYLITEIYLFAASCIILADTHGARMPILFNLKSLFLSRGVYRALAVIAGLALAVGLCLFPMSPGPVVIGDLLPVCMLILVETRLMVPHGRKTLWPGDWLGFACLWSATVHFILPGIVIL